MKSTSIDRSDGSTWLTYISIDADLPLEVDDEFWEHIDPSQAFVQPTGIPSRVSVFVWHLKIQIIMSDAMKTIVSGSV
jgi:hypothetical protein